MYIEVRWDYELIVIEYGILGLSVSKKYAVMPSTCTEADYWLLQDLVELCFDIDYLYIVISD